MIVVADTSPINYLVLIEEIEILTKMYGTVVVPHAVREELLRPSAPEPVRIWTGLPPAWLKVQRPLTAPDPSLAALDLGERDAILRGRREAERRGIPVIGTLGLLREASILGLLDLRLAIKRLEATSFHIAPEVLVRLLNDCP